jgi:hypothetical protein
LGATTRGGLRLAHPRAIGIAAVKRYSAKVAFNKRKLASVTRQFGKIAVLAAGVVVWNSKVIWVQRQAALRSYVLRR